jgi:hypothetical protein
MMEQQFIKKKAQQMTNVVNLELIAPISLLNGQNTVKSTWAKMPATNIK